MNSKQYEELCRFFLSHKLGMAVEDIKSVYMPNPKRPGLPEYKHQIDLYWETGNEVTLYLNIANAKWRSSQKVDQQDVLLLGHVKQKVGAHKAVMLTNFGFTAGAKAAAQDEGIALHIVRPTFKYGTLPKQDPNIILAKLQEIEAVNEKPIYLHQIVHRAFVITNLETKPYKPSSYHPTNKPTYTTKKR